MTNEPRPRNRAIGGNPSPFPSIERVSGSEVHLLTPTSTARVLGTAQGLSAEATRVAAAFASLEPTHVALGIAHDDLQHLEGAEAADPTPTEAAYLHGLRRYGPATLPPPDLQEAFRLAHDARIPIYGLDLPEDEYTHVLFQNVRGRDLMRQGLRQRAIPDAPDAHAYCRAWAEQERGVPGYAELHHEREGFIADRLLELLEPERRILAVVDVADLEGIHEALTEARYLP